VQRNAAERRGPMQDQAQVGVTRRQEVEELGFMGG
jgi:hypothetical protein